MGNHTRHNTRAVDGGGGVRVRVVGSAGVGNDFDEIIDGGYEQSAADEIWSDAQGLAVELSGFGFTALVVCDDGRELEPEEWIACGRPPSTSTDNPTTGSDE